MAWMILNAQLETLKSTFPYVSSVEIVRIAFWVLREEQLCETEWNFIIEPMLSMDVNRLPHASSQTWINVLSNTNWFIS